MRDLHSGLRRRLSFVGCVILSALCCTVAHAKPVTQLQLLNQERAVMHCKSGDARCLPRAYGDTLPLAGGFPSQHMDWGFDSSQQRLCRTGDLNGRIFDMLYFDDIPATSQPNAYAYTAFTDDDVVVYSGLMGNREQRELTTAAVEADVASFLNIVPHIYHHYTLDGGGYMKNIFYNPYTKYRCTVMTRDTGAREAGDLVIFGYRPERNGITYRKVYAVFRPMQ